MNVLYWLYANTRVGSWLHAYQVSQFQGKEGHHSVPPVKFQGFRVETVAILGSNYGYIIIDESTNKAAVVDPADPQCVLDRVSALGVELTTVLTTHKHWDHAGGNGYFAEKYPEVEIVGGQVDQPSHANKLVGHGDVIIVGNLKIDVHFAPCHTKGHILFTIASEAGECALFSGDTLFLGGCGKFFEGSAEEMHRNYKEIILQLPKETKIFCGHEYGSSNLQFAQFIEPRNEALRKKLLWCLQQEEKGEGCVPSTLEEELAYNPWIRCAAAEASFDPDLPELRDASTTIEVFGRLRELKNNGAHQRTPRSSL